MTGGITINTETEKRAKKTAAVRAAEKLRIRKLDERVPLSNDGLTNVDNIFRWYVVKNREDYKAVSEAYGGGIREPPVYPEIICVETVGREAYEGDAYDHQMADCRKVTEDFWKQLGYKCRMKKIRMKGKRYRRKKKRRETHCNQQKNDRKKMESMRKQERRNYLWQQM